MWSRGELPLRREAGGALLQAVATELWCSVSLECDDEMNSSLSEAQGCLC